MAGVIDNVDVPVVNDLECITGALDKGRRGAPHVASGVLDIGFVIVRRSRSGTEGASLQAIVATVDKCVDSPCLRTRVTVSLAPVDGDHVMLNDVPAVMVLSVVKENGF